MPMDNEFWLHRLTQRLIHKQTRYAVREAWAIGDHPVPNGDERFTNALKEIQEKAKTNYVSLAHKAVTDRMRVRTFKFGGEHDEDAMKIWKANNMATNASIAIKNAAMFSDVYALVLPPEEGKEPRISIEDPRCCIIEPDPVDPFQAKVGLKFYEDHILDHTVAVLYFPDRIVTYHGPTSNDYLSIQEKLGPADIASSGAFDLVDIQPNPLGEVPLVRGAWQPEFGLRGMAECEDGGWDIQNRINHTILLRMVIANSQAFRQRWVTGAKAHKDRHGVARKAQFEPSADIIWSVVDENAKFGDFEQADLNQLLEAAKDDVGDFAAVTQTPVTYLTNKMINVSANTLTAAQASLVTKVRSRMDSMGWFFERVMKLCFAYKGDSEKAQDIEAETVWNDPELRTMAEIGDMVSKWATAGIDIRLILERAGLSPEEVEYAAEKFEEKQEQEQQFMMDQMEKQASMRPAGPAGAAKKPPSKTSVPAGKPAAPGKAPAKAAPAKKPKPKPSK